MRGERFDRRSLLARALRAGYAVLLGALAAIAIVVGGTITVLETRAGAELAKRVALRQLNARIPGRLQVERLSFRADRLALDGLALFDPDGRMVVSIERLEVAFALRALPHRRVEIDALVARRPHVTLVESERGLTVARAFAAAGAPDRRTPTRKGPPSRFTVAVRGWEITGGDLDWRRAGGDRVLRLSELATFGELQLGGGQLRTAATVEAPDLRLDLRGRLGFSAGTLSSFEATAAAVLPGATMTARATERAGTFDASAEVDADDLAALARRLGSVLDSSLPAIEGRGRLAVAVSGPAAGPALRITLRVPDVQVGTNRLRGLKANAVIPDLRSPEALDLQLETAAAFLYGHSFHALAVATHTSGRRLSVRVRASGADQLSLDLGGRREVAGRAVQIERLRLDTPGARWSLARPARLVLGPDRLVIAGLALGAGRQRIEADLSLGLGDGRRAGTPRAAGHLALHDIDLGLLPRALLPPGTKLGGRLDAEARFAAGPGAPSFEVTAALAGGQLGRLKEIALRLEARAAGGRARGRLDARGPGAAVGARFDLPARWPLGRGRAPFAVEVALASTDLAVASAAIATATGAHPPKLAGQARITARLEGSTDSPTLAADLQAGSLALAGRPLGDLIIKLRANGDHPTEVHLEATGPPAARSARVRLSVTTPLGLRAMLRRPPSAAALARTPVEIGGDAGHVPLALVAPFVRGLPPLGGSLSCEVSLSGPLQAPLGTVSVSADGVTSDGLRPTDGRLALTIRPGAIEAHARVLRASRPLAVAEVTVDADLSALRAPTSLAGAPVRARLVLGPLVAQQHDTTIIHNQDHASARAALLRAALSVDGSLRAPRAELDADVRAVNAQGAPVATARITGRYGDHQTSIDARLASAHDGTLQATAQLSADLDYEAVTRGIDLGKLPWKVQVVARRFELDALLGFTPGLRTTGGHLDGSLRGQGTVRDPHLEGHLAGKASALAISGLGEYHDVSLSLAGDERRLRLDELVAHVGGGHARVSGEIARDARGLRLSARGDISRFPIYIEGQPVALLSLRATATGGERSAGTDVEVGIAEARIELSDEERRSLQSLKTPPDVIVMQGGRPRGRDEAAKLGALPAAVSEAAGVPPGQGAPAEAAGRPPIRITLKAERRLWVTGHDAHLELGLSPGFRIELGARQEIFGQVTVRRGRIDIYGRRFDLRSDSTLRWSGPADLPELDVSALYENRDENVSVLVTLKGPLGHTAIAVSSPNRPELTETQLYGLIISGQLQGSRNATPGASASTEALSLAGGLVAAGLQNAIAKSLHLDVFSIDTSGGPNLVGTQVEAGRYVTDRLYVGYVGRIGADPTRYQNRNAVHAEFRLSSRWEIEAEYGDVGTGSADVIWKRNY